MSWQDEKRSPTVTGYNFQFPVETLTGDDFQLEPFEPDKHAAEFFQGTGTSPELYKYMPFGPFQSPEDFVQNFSALIEADSDRQLYAIMTTRRSKINTSDEAAAVGTRKLAGIAGYIFASKLHLRTEIGPLILVPKYQGIGLAQAVVELLTQHALSSPDAGGWGMLRVAYIANTTNTASIKVAEKSGFRKEGVTRWHMVFHDSAARGKIGHGRNLPDWVEAGAEARDSVMFSRCWDD